MRCWAAFLQESDNCPKRLRSIRRPFRLRPDLARARLDLASVLAAQGDMKAAVLQLREASKGNDPEVARLAAGALQRLGER